MKKIISLILSVLIILSLPATPTVYANGVEYETAVQDMFSSKSVYNGYLRINTYDADCENLYIPKTMEFNGREYPVMLNSEVFLNNTTVKNVKIADGVALWGMHARLFYGAKNLITAKIENNGKFLNPEVRTGTCSEFYGCTSLKECYNLSQYSACQRVELSGINSMEELNTLPENASSYVIQSTSLKSICDIPKQADSLELIAPNIENDIYILSEHLSKFSLLEKPGSIYINGISLTIFAPANSQTMETLLKFQANHHNIYIRTLDNTENKSRENIYCIGDSLTAGGYYTKSLQELVSSNQIIHKYAAEGDYTLNGVYRTGAEKITVENDILIPYGKTKIKVKLSDHFCRSNKKISQDSAGVNCCKIGGIEGFLSYENGSYYFQRAKAGRVTAVAKGTAVETEFSRHYSKGDTLVLYFGTNDFNSGNFTDEKAVRLYADRLQSIIDYCQCKNYIVAGIAFGGSAAGITTSSANMKAYDDIMKNRFGGHYLNIRQYFMDNCRTICPDLELTKEDEALLTQGIVPSVFYFDKTTHWDAETGGKVVAQAIYEKLSELGYTQATVNPTCTSNGYTIHKCNLCSDEYKTDYTDKTAHRYDNGKITKKAACTANGIKTYTCTACKATKTQTIKATGHKAVKDKAVKPTYVKSGKTEGSHCSVCKKIIKAQKSVAKLTLAKPSAVKLSAAPKGFKLSWKKAKDASGYQIQYSASSKFKGAKTVTVNNKTTSKKISKLKAKKKYYVRIRTYKSVKVNGKNTKVYSGWSKAKTVKTK